MSDWHSMKLAKKANGIYEPEMRLRLLWIPSIITPIALLMMGLGPFYEAHWIVFVLGLGLINIAGPLATIIILNYAFDCYHSMAPTGADKKAQLINHKSAPYIVAAMIIAMSMAFGYVSVGVSNNGEVANDHHLGICCHSVDSRPWFQKLWHYRGSSCDSIQPVYPGHHQVRQANASARPGIL